MQNLHGLDHVPVGGPLARLCAELVPGSRPTPVRRLRGGISAAMHAFDLVEPSGARRPLVLRRYGAWALSESNGVYGVATRAWRTLQLLEQLGLPAPRPVWFDPTVVTFGTPAMLMTRLPGGGDLRPRDPAAWLRQQAEALAMIHQAPLDGVDLSFLPGWGLDGGQPATLPATLRERLADDADGAALLPVLDHWLPRIEPVASVLLHGDYWTGNTLWRRGKLEAVVDWDQAELGSPARDLGSCRGDLVMLAGEDAPEQFRCDYERATGARPRQLFIWDLLAAATALAYLGQYLTGYHDLGRTDLTPALVRARLRSLIGRALVDAG